MPEPFQRHKLIVIDDTGATSSISVDDDYIERAIEDMDLDEEEVDLDEEEVDLVEHVPHDEYDAYSSDSEFTIPSEDCRNCSDSSDFSDNDNILAEADFDTLVQKNTSVFLFRNGNLEPLTFVLLLNDYSAELKLTKVIEKSGGLVYSKVKDMDDYCMVIVRDDCLITAHLGPVFKLQYVLKCIEKNKIVSINHYLKTFDNAPAVHKFDYMKVVYFKDLGWSELPKHILLNRKIDVGRKELKVVALKVPIKCTVQDSSDDSNDEPIVNRSSVLLENAQRVTESNSIKKAKRVTVLDSSDDDSLKIPSSVKCEKVERRSARTVNKHTRMFYSSEEDSNIVRYIADNDSYNGVKGTLLWKDMERVNICPKRTWQSLKEHFLKKVLYNMNSYTFLTAEQKRKFHRLLLK